MSDQANTVQVGGNHYQQDSMQHWDFAIAANLGYLEGQITKYIDRHGRKNKRQDIEKARHFAVKLLETIENGLVKPRAQAIGPLKAFLDTRLRYSTPEYSAVTNITLWQSANDVRGAIIDLDELLRQAYGSAADPAHSS